MTLYVPSMFRVEDRDALFRFMEQHAFATLVSSSDEGLQISHIPFVPEREADGRIRLLGHVARANPHAQSIANARHVVAIFEGPHGYVSPTWYEDHPAVPTWNYAVVHAHGTARLLDDRGLRDVIARLSDRYEAGRPNAWRIDSAPADFIEKLAATIVGFAIDVERLEAKFKLSQNRPGRDAERVIEALEAEGSRDLAALMREHLARPKVRIPS
ncbi:MAG: FMN-binding negative transcriptional regulator [Bacillota bacterium]